MTVLGFEVRMEGTQALPIAEQMGSVKPPREPGHQLRGMRVKWS